MGQTRQHRRWLGVAAALAVGLALRAAAIHSLARVTGDGQIYGAIARNLLEHGVYGYQAEAGRVLPTLIRLPGYPLFLALCFKVFGVLRWLPVLWLQTLADLLTCVLASAVAERLFGPRAGLAALWLGVLCPFTANYVVAPLTETLTLLMIALALYLLVRWQEAGAGVNRWAVALGGTLAYAVLLRPEQGLLAAAILPAMLWLGVRRSPGWWRAPLLSACLTVVPLVPWAARNWHTFHVVQPLAPRWANDPGEAVPLGFNRWYRTWAVDFASTDEVYWNYDSAEIDPASLPARAFDSPAERAATLALLADYNETTSAGPELDARFAGLARQRVARHPLRSYLLLPAARVGNMLLRPRLDMLDVPLRWWRFREHPRATVFAALYGLLNLAYLALAGVVVAQRGWPARWTPLIAAMLATLVLRLALLATLDNSEPRYTLEFFPVLFVLAAGAWRRAHRSPGGLAHEASAAVAPPGSAAVRRRKSPAETRLKISPTGDGSRKV